MKKNKSNFSVKLFVVISITSLLTLLIIFSIFNFSNKLQYNISNKPNPDKYFFNNFEQKDPLITKVPNLSDILRGPIISDSDPSLGNKPSKISIIFFSDFTCDYCRNQEKILKKIVEEYNLRLIWKDYPDTNTNSTSFKASLASRCAYEQGKFWEYHDLLFDKNKQLNNNIYFDLAYNIKLDITKFKKCLNDEKTTQLIKDNIKEANALEITGIPFIYVNDQEIMGEISYEDLKKIVEIQLNKQNDK